MRPEPPFVPAAALAITPLSQNAVKAIPYKVTLIEAYAR
jgi:hypothetical protein